MRVLSLFSGGGLGDYGLELAGMEIVGQVEIDDYCQKILKLRWPDVPKWRDIKNVTGKEILERCGTVDLISGGFPCQPFSTSGRRKGKDDNRNLWPEMFRLISEIEPSFVFAENVRGIVTKYIDRVLDDLESIGYSCIPLLVPACFVGTPHKRERLWIVANNSKPRLEGQARNGDSSRGGRSSDLCCAVADSESIGSRSTRKELHGRNGLGRSGIWPAKRGEGQYEWEPARSLKSRLGRDANGREKSYRMERIKLLGNGQVVQVVEWIGKQIMKFNVKESEKP